LLGLRPKELGGTVMSKKALKRGKNENSWGWG